MPKKAAEMAKKVDLTEVSEISQKERAGGVGGFREKLGVPAKISAEDMVRSVRLVNDKGGNATIGLILEAFGGPKRREYLSRALGMATEFGFLDKDGRSFKITGEGKAFLASEATTQKQTIGSKILAYQPYHDVFLRLRDAKDHVIKKDQVTEMWSSIAGGGRNVRERMTGTFASFGLFGDVLEDSGRSLTLRAEPLTILNSGAQIGTESVLATTTPPAKILSSVPAVNAPLQLDITCPRCNRKDVGILNEDPVRYLAVGDNTVVYVKYTLHCRNCKEPFSRHGQHGVPGKLHEPSV